MTEIKRPSMALYDPLDKEQTRLTEIAQRALEAALEDTETHGGAYPVQFVRLLSGDVIVVEVHGQSSVTGHGKQGLRPERLAFLRQLADDGFHVLLVFIEGYDSWRYAFLRDLGAAQAISHGEDGAPGSKRFGWHVSEFSKGNGALMLPAAVPPARERAQGALV